MTKQRRRVTEKEKVGRNQGNLGAWLLSAELVESDTSPCGRHMEPIVVARDGLEQGQRRGCEEDWLRRGEARTMELKNDTYVSLWLSQPSVRENQPSYIGLITRRSWRESHDDQSLK